MTHTSVSDSEQSEVLFPEVAAAWLESRENHIGPRTFKDYQHYIKTLNAYFGETPPQEITPDHVRAYQRMRLAKVGAGAVNKELGILIQIRKRMRIPLDDYQRLPPAKDYEAPGRALEDWEESRLVKVFREAAEHKTWDVAALTSLLSMFSGLGPGEIRSLKLKHVSLNPACVTVPRAGAKRQKRERPVILDETGGWALRKLAERAATKCKCTEPEHYLIPFRKRDHTYDPTQPSSSTAWREALYTLLDLADIKIRNYDFRHHAVSKALSDPRVSLTAAKAHFGWISPKMIDRYYHGNVATLKVVAAAIEGRTKASQSVADFLKKHHGKKPPARVSA